MAEHAIMKAKLDGFINPQVAITKYDEKATDYPSRYRAAIAYYQLKEPDKALKLIDALLANSPRTRTSTS
jgi:predicted Zn-dependent protease